MPELILPLETAPGSNPTESGGRLINCVVEKGRGRSKFLWRRAPGLIERFVTGTGHRGSLLVGSVLLVLSDDTVFGITKSGVTYTVTAFTGDPVGGTGKVTMDRNMNATPQVLIEHSAGMSQVDVAGESVADFSDADLPDINSLCYVGGYFMTTAGNGQMNSSGVNAVTFGANDKANAEQSPDGLVRGIRYGRDLAAMGVSTIEFWGNVGNPTGFPFSFSSVIPLGLLTKFAVAGFEPGFSAGVVFVASDKTVHLLVGYSSQKISTPDLESLIEALDDVDTLEMSVYVSKGRSVAVLSCDDWTWEYTFPDKDHPGGWTERKSYGEARWRAIMGVNAFSEWLVFDKESDQVFKVDEATQTEDADPLIFEVRSTQVHAFPTPIEFHRLSLDFEPGVGVAAGQDPIETDPRVLVSYSDDGGRTFSSERELRLGGQGEMVTVEDWLWGQSGPRGRQWRFRISDPVTVALMGGAWDGNVTQ